MGIPVALYGSVIAIRKGPGKGLGWLGLGFVSAALLIVLVVLFRDFVGRETVISEEIDMVMRLLPPGIV